MLGLYSLSLTSVVPGSIALVCVRHAHDRDEYAAHRRDPPCVSHGNRLRTEAVKLSRVPPVTHLVRTTTRRRAPRVHRRCESVLQPFCADG
jgi:hypothetical protein